MDLNTNKLTVHSLSQHDDDTHSREYCMTHSWWDDFMKYDLIAS